MSDINNEGQALRDQFIQIMIEEAHQESMVKDLYKEIDRLSKDVSRLPVGEQSHYFQTVRNAILAVRASVKHNK